MAHVNNDEVGIFFDDRGSGSPVLLIHGHTLDHRIWSGVAEGLEASGHRLLLPDLRGHGKSSVPGFGYHWSHHAADMEAVLDAAAVDRATVIGFSLGGGIAIEMALTRPERVESLVLMAPVMPDRPFEAAFMDNLKQVARTVRGEGVAAAMAGPWMESPLFAPSLAKPGVRDALAAIVGDFPGAEYVATQRDRVERDWMAPERLSEIDIPTTVVVGALEMPGFRSFADEAAAGIPGARLEVIEGCAHLLPLEAPEETARIIAG